MYTAGVASLVVLSVPAVHAAELATASRAGAIEAFHRISNNFPDGRWLGPRNRYRTDTVQRLKADSNPTGVVKQKQLADYIAGSVVTHIGDGWGYLGRASQALMLGDVALARHLAYYAELRAAMSLLAAQGIGVFNNKHAVITGPDTVSTNLSGGTHSFVWTAFKWWAESQGSRSVIESFLRPDGTELAKWFSPAPAYSAWVTVAADWITSLGIDLQTVSDDQERRNEASYRPTRIEPGSGVPVVEEVQFLAALWRVLEPSSGGFRTLEMHMLRLLIEKSFRAVEGNKASSTNTKFSQLIDAITGALPDPSASSRIRDFLLRNSDGNDHPVFHHAAVRPSSVGPRDPRGMVGRAALLLSIATACGRQFVNEAGGNLDDLRFWWGNLGSERGLWATPPSATDIEDLWQDFEIVLDDLVDWLGSPPPLNRDSLILEVPAAFSRLGMFEIVAIWGVAA